MRPLPKPDEPTFEILKGHADGYNGGMGRISPEGKTVKSEPVAKQGMIGFLSAKWESHDISYKEVKEATGNLNTPIGQWHNGKYSWDRVMENYETELDCTIE